MTVKMLIDLNRCIGCWTCSIACKMGWKLEDEDYRLIVRTHGSGAGIDRPQGEYPDLKMNWQPVYEKSCTFCGPRVAQGSESFCSYNCPTKALAFGDADDESSAFSKELARCIAGNYSVFELSDYEDKHPNVVYASKG